MNIDEVMRDIHALEVDLKNYERKCRREQRRELIQYSTPI